MKNAIVIAVETLLSGGAELFAVRMANGLISHYNVSLVVVNGDMVDTRVSAKLSSEVDLYRIRFSTDSLIRKIDSLLLKLRIDFSFRQFLTERRVRKILANQNPLVLHTNQFKVDHLFTRANKELRARHIITIHGDYINFYKQFREGNLRILNYLRKAKRVLSTVDGIAYISDHQLRFFLEEWKLTTIVEKVRKIYNGLDKITKSNTDEFANNFERKGFVYGMVARGIKEKGWEIVIRSFLSLNRPNAQLILVGESAYLDKLKSEYVHENVYFTGYSSNPMDRISLFDVGLLPTTFPSESLPTSIIEYLVMGKPVIASDAGEIKNMVIQHNKEAGIVLHIDGGVISEEELTRAMRKLMDDKNLYSKFQKETTQHAKAFDLNACVTSYLNFYKN